MLYTIGERVEGGYVTGKDVKKKEIKISKTRTSGASEVRFTDVNWHSDIVQHQVLNITAQTRYRGPRISGRIDGDRFFSTSNLPELPAPGQSIVFYSPRSSFGEAGDGEKLVGGGIITS